MKVAAQSDNCVCDIQDKMGDAEERIEQLITEKSKFTEKLKELEERLGEEEGERGAWVCCAGGVLRCCICKREWVGYRCKRGIVL